MSDYKNLVPSPASLIESLRNIGYSIETAISDIVDNSITAKASQIDIRFSWNSGDPWLAIVDNGQGMTEGELIEAMRFGSMNPLTTRLADDLGRFGLGMKTASFSQCRHLTVLSKKKGELSCCEWDLGLLSRAGNTDWTLGVLDTSTLNLRKTLSSIYDTYLSHSDTGTILLWKKIDRLKEQVTPEKQERHFNGLIDDSRKHMELIFHRFLSSGPGKTKLTISINGDPLIAFNPFNPRDYATQELSEQKILLEGEAILIQPYVLPHHNKASKQEYRKYSGEQGYLQNQGFYVYRNRRLIIKGTWFRLIKKEELNKLIRIRVDLPNALDHLWKIDVKKSHAFPPESIRNELKQVIDKIKDSGRRVYLQRGKKIAKINSPVWNRIISGGSISYQINRKHPLVAKLLATLPVEQKEFLKNLLTMFESSFPVDLFFHDIATKPEQVKKTDLKKKELKMLIEVFIQSWRSSGILENDFLEKLIAIDPFASNQMLTQKILEQIIEENE